ncbi:GTP-binding protein [Acidithiobacillus caldus ATCC 51756]|jgi:phosphatidylserine/phosphatidylglycerophosphate/cardiolipin synthase-like enzyme|uniref:phospholipase D-like domain-containing protein n=1 Tax=Acidithiobacillus caldus TaxID=33059 RepID=UPI001C07E877|nr:phospholipase D-like domain-containing protein [Acidithiobacillus caldus]MBU2734281.1 GTP-binding protein [Acidithiobacillus caldus ATCC 51756]MBU2801737.1 GTP-binding protein [Acidithiobacillus caldus]
MHLFIEPQAGAQPVLQIIQAARRNLRMEVYFLSDGRVLRALTSAHERGVDVQVILDHHPYGLPAWKVRKEAESVERTGATLHWAPRRFEAVDGRYVYEHAKYTCNNHTCEIGTGNYGWDSFHHDRDYDLVTSNPTIVHAANTVFTADWNNRRAGNFPHRVLVLSPHSAAKILAVIRQPGPIVMESEELGDYHQILAALAAKGRSARILLPASISAQDHRNAEALARAGVDVRLLPTKPVYLHGKTICGQRSAFVGSENVSYSSIQENREMGLIVHGQPVNEIQQQFATDWSHSEPLSAWRPKRRGGW